MNAPAAYHGLGDRWPSNRGDRRGIEWLEAERDLGVRRKTAVLFRGVEQRTEAAVDEPTDIADVYLAHCKEHDRLSPTWFSTLHRHPPCHDSPAQRPRDIQDAYYKLVHRGIHSQIAFAPEGKRKHQIQRCLNTIRMHV